MAIDDATVAFRVRDARRPGKRRVVRLPAQEFMRRFLLHVLPSGFTRIRHYGFLANARKRQRLAAARAALDAPAPQPAAIESARQFMARVAQVEIERCPCCGAGKMRVVAVAAAASGLHLVSPARRYADERRSPRAEFYLPRRTPSGAHRSYVPGFRTPPRTTSAPAPMSPLPPAPRACYPQAPPVPRKRAHRASRPKPVLSLSMEWLPARA